MPEVGDEVAVIFEDGDPERPVILGSVWNGVQQAPRHGYYGEDIPNNDVKRIVTKSGNRIQIADMAGNEAITIATPNHNSLTFSESHTATGRPLIALSSSGDIVLSAPEGRVHIQSKFFSREVGDAGGPTPNGGSSGASGAGPPAGAPSEGFFHGLAGGLYGSTLKPLGHMVMHPIETVEGIGHAVAHPVETAQAVGHAVAATSRGVMSGDGRAIGTAIGTVGMFAIPGADVAEGAEDAARVGQVGELAEGAEGASQVGTAGELANTPQYLKAANPEKVADLSTFTTKGVSEESANSYLATPEGQIYLSEAQALDPSADADTVFRRASSQVQSGVDLPTMTSNFTDPLVKVVPSGASVSSYTPFFTTQKSLNEAVASGKPIGDSLGLPLASHADSYDVFQINPPSKGGTVFTSQIAPTSELGGQYTTTAGSMQTLVPNRTDWSSPLQTGTVP